MDYKIKKALTYMDENLDKNLNLQKVAQNLRISKTYFCKLFKKETKICFSKYLIRIRIKKAKEFLRDDSFSVKEISYKVGYKFVSNFNHDFKKHTKLTPLEYKNNYRKIIMLKLKKLTIEMVEPVLRFTKSILKYTKRMARFTK